MDLTEFLSDFLDGCARLAVVGAGSVLKSDDGAGTILAERLSERFPGAQSVLFCPGETAPENFTGKIIAFRPTHILLVDACDVGAVPGAFCDIPPERVGGPLFLTHMLPLKVMLNYLTGETGAVCKLLGIQSETIAFDGVMSERVCGAVDDAFRLLEGEIARRFS